MLWLMLVIVMITMMHINIIVHLVTVLAQDDQDKEVTWQKDLADKNQGMQTSNQLLYHTLSLLFS